MRVGPPTPITSANLTGNVDEAIPTAWSNAVTYGLGDVRAVVTGTVAEVYDSLQATNLNHTPASSPTWWRHLGTIYAPWAIGTTYAADNWVTRKSRLYRSLAGGNLGADPATSPNKWQDRGPSNRMAMFDLTTSKPTVRPGMIQWSFTVAGRIDAMGFGTIAASTLNVTMEAGGEEVFNEDFSLVSDAGISSWLEWLYEPIVRKSSFYLTDLPSYANPTVTATLTGPDNVQIAHYAAAYLRRIGYTEFGGSAGVNSFSTIENDAFGENRTYTKRGFTKRAQVKVEFATRDFDAVNDYLAPLEGVPLLILGSDIHRTMNVFGTFSDWETTIGNVTKSYLTARLEGF